MPFTILNEAAASNTNQAEPDTVDFEILRLAHEDTGVTKGVTQECAVDEAATPNQTVDIAAGETLHTGTKKTISSQNFAMPAADGTNPRFDLVVIDSAGVPKARQGTAAAEPEFPTLTAGDVCLAAVYRAKDDNTIANAEIVDKRMIIRQTTGALFNVQDEGAVGDGVADDTTEIQAAIDAATVSGGVVYFPSTSAFYKISDELVAKADCALKGDSLTTSIIKQITANKDCIRFNTGDDHISVEDLRLESDVTAPSEAGDAIRMNGNRVCYLANVNINGSDTKRWKHGLNIDDNNSLDNIPGSGEADGRASRWFFAGNLYIQAISADTDSWAVHINRRVSGWGFNFVGGIWQTEKLDDGVEYTTRGHGGLLIESIDGAHFSEIEIIAFDRPAVIDATGGYHFITNMKFHSVSVESVKTAGNGALEITGAGVIGSTAFSGCTFFGAAIQAGIRHGLVIDTSAGATLVDLSWVNCYFGSDKIVTGCTGIEIKNGANVSAFGPFIFTNCHVNNADVGLLIDSDVTNVQLNTIEFGDDIDTAIDVNGSDNKVLQLKNTVFDPAITLILDFSGYTGSYLNVYVTENSPRPLANIIHPVIEDHFLGSIVTSGYIGQLGWTTYGSGTVSIIAAEAGHHGIFRRNSTIDNVWASFVLGNQLVKQFDIALDFHLVFVVKSRNQSNGEIRFGIASDSIVDAPSDGIYMDRPAIGGNWHAVTRASASETDTDTGVASNSTNWFTMEIIREGSTVRFYIDHLLEATHTADLPTGAMFPFAASRGSGGIEGGINMDYFRLEDLEVSV